MGEDPKTHFGLLKEVQLEHTNLWFDYWQNFSDYDTWQFGCSLFIDFTAYSINGSC